MLTLALLQIAKYISISQPNQQPCLHDRHLTSITVKLILVYNIELSIQVLHVVCQTLVYLTRTVTTSELTSQLKLGSKISAGLKEQG